MKPRLRWIQPSARVKLLALAAFSGLFWIACVKSPAGATGQEPAAAQTPTAASPARLDAADLSKLRWIEGIWRGTGDIERPFYERYSFEPNAVLVEGFEDETLGKSTGVTRFELKEGELGGGNDGWRWVVTKLEEGAVTFAPVVKARNSFRWERVSADEWRAVLEWPAAADRPARRRVYRMERWTPTTSLTSALSPMPSPSIRPSPSVPSNSPAKP